MVSVFIVGFFSSLPTFSDPFGGGGSWKFQQIPALLWFKCPFYRFFCSVKSKIYWREGIKEFPQMSKTSLCISKLPELVWPLHLSPKITSSEDRWLHGTFSSAACHRQAIAASAGILISNAIMWRLLNQVFGKRTWLFLFSLIPSLPSIFLVFKEPPSLSYIRADQKRSVQRMH